MDKCPKCSWHLVNCPCCDTWFCHSCGLTEEELENEETEEED